MFSVDGLGYTLCKRVYEFVVLSLLFLLTAIPVVTIPVGLAALFGVSRRLQHDGSTRLSPTFFKMCKENFAQGMISGWILAAIGIFLYADRALLRTMVHGPIHILILAVVWGLSLLWFSVILHMFPLMVHLQTSIRQLFVSAIKLSIYRVHLTLLNMALVILAALLSFHFLLAMFILFPAFSCYITFWFVDRKIKSLQAVMEPSQQPL